MLGLWLTYAGATEKWPFEGKPDVRVDITASRVDAPGSDSPSAEYVCLVNKGGDGVDLLGWILRDAEGQVNVLPDISLDSEQSVRVHPGEGSNSSADVYGTKGTAVWNNTGDTVTLFDSEGDEIDSQTYGQASEAEPAPCGP